MGLSVVLTKVSLQGVASGTEAARKPQFGGFPMCKLEMEFQAGFGCAHFVAKVAFHWLGISEALVCGTSSLDIFFCFLFEKKTPHRKHYSL